MFRIFILTTTVNDICEQMSPSCGSTGYYYCDDNEQIIAQVYLSGGSTRYIRTYIKATVASKSDIQKIKGADQSDRSGKRSKEHLKFSNQRTRRSDARQHTALQLCS